MFNPIMTVSDGGYIHVIQRNSVADTFTIGHMAGCPKGCVLHMLMKVHNATLAEQVIITRLKSCKALVHCPSIESNESFKGSLVTIMAIVAQTVAALLEDYKLLEDTVVENPLITFMDMLYKVPLD